MKSSRGRWGSWEDLPSVILELILELLTMPDYIRIAGVCTWWRDVQREHHLRHAWSARHARQMMPWLLSPNAVDQQKEEGLVCYSPSEQRYYYQLSLPPRQSMNNMHCRHYLGSSHGWLLLLDSNYDNPDDDDQQSLLLLDLINRSQIRIRLPPPRHPDSFHYISAAGVLSSVPTDPGCIVLLWEEDRLMFCLVRDEIWTDYRVLPDVLPNVLPNVVLPFISSPGFPSFLGDKVYAWCKRSSNIVIIDLFPVVTRRFVPMDGGMGSGSLVESDGQLLMVRVKWEDEGKSIVKTVDVYRADLEERKWERLESLGDRVLFISDLNPFSLSAAEVGGPGNHIYFNQVMVDRTTSTVRQFWIEYDYEKRRATTHSWSSETRCRGHFMLWMVPRIVTSINPPEF